MDAKQFIEGVNQGLPPYQGLQDAFASSAEYARTQSRQVFNRLNNMCALFAAGENRDYEAVSRCAHLAAYELMSYSEISASLDVRPNEECEQIMAAARGMLTRVREHESQYLAGALSPSEVFYDDLFNSDVIDAEHGQKGFGKREDLSRTPVQASELQPA